MYFRKTDQHRPKQACLALPSATAVQAFINNITKLHVHRAPPNEYICGKMNEHYHEVSQGV